MNDRFVDTSGWASWTVDRDSFYDLAGLVVNETLASGGELVTTNWVLAELTALLHSPFRLPKPTRILILDDIRSDPSVRVVVIDPDLEAEAWDLWRTRPDKDWSLVDCASFVVMARLGITEAVTADHHFEQAGFARLLR